MMLSRGAIDLMLRVLEAPKLVVSAEALNISVNKLAGELVAHGLLVDAGWQQTVEDQDGLHPVGFDEACNQHGYHSPSEGWTTVERESLRLFRPDLRKCLVAMLGPDIRMAGKHPLSVDGEDVLEVGSLQLGPRQAMSIWFARRLFDRNALHCLSAAIERRPSTNMRIVLTPTPANLLPDGAKAPFAQIVSVHDVLSAGAPARIDLDVLRMRLLGTPAEMMTEVLWVSDDGSQLISAGDELVFRGAKQRKVLVELYKTYRTGSRIKLGELLQKAGSSSRDVESLFKADWRRLSKYIDRKGGYYTLRLPD